MALDRKALIKQYKDTPRTAGVGAVRNTASGKVFIVAGRDLPSLLNRHRAQLRLSAHPNRTLQDDWNTLGSDVFEFVVLDTLPLKTAPDYDPTEDLRTLEELWFDKLKPYGTAGYHRARK